MAICWKPSLATGVSKLDNQHKELFRQVDGLAEAMKQGKGREEIAQLLDFLGKYVVRHFADEEAFMERYNCPAAEANKQAHAQLIAKFKTLRERIDQAGCGPTVVIETHKILLNWLVDHIDRIDTQLQPCVVGAEAHTAAVG